MASSVSQSYHVFDTGEQQFDAETGELVTPVVKEWKPIKHDDSETGEQTQIRIVYQRSKFRVPRSALKLPVFETAVHDSSKKTDKESVFNVTLLVLPLLMVLPGWAIFLYIMAEMLYHNWSHANRKAICNTPMQAMFHHKCAECVAKRQMLKVGKLQDQRMLKLNSRRILHYDYAQFGIGS